MQVTPTTRSRARFARQFSILPCLLNYKLKRFKALQALQQNKVKHEDHNDTPTKNVEVKFKWSDFWDAKYSIGLGASVCCNARQNVAI